MSGLTAEVLSRLLAWLDPDSEQAARRYQSIQARLTRLFAYRGCPDAARLADEVIDRVAGKASELAPGYRGDPALFFYGVARNVLLEDQRRRGREARAARTAPVVASPDVEHAHTCLERCLHEELSLEERELILEYYRSARTEKIEKRRWLADDQRLSAPALRKRTQRIRARLKGCVGRCLEAGP